MRRSFAAVVALCGYFASGFQSVVRGVGQRRGVERLFAAEMDEAEFEKALAAMTSFSNRYVKLSDTKYCSEASVPAVVIRGLAEHKVTLGAPLCPCRFYEDKQAEAKDGYWNCQCVHMRERKECHCMLFLTEDNEFVGDSTEITVDEIQNLTA